MEKYPPIVPGYPHLLHGGDYNPDQWRATPDVWDEDIRLAKLADINSWSVGIFAWTALEPEEGKYDFSWLDEIMDRMAANNMKAVLATPTGARPAWMSQKYPEVLRVNEQRQKMLHGRRHNHCFTSPIYREKTWQINTELAKRYANHPALGVWHLSNEYNGDCHCPLCQEAFRNWLKKQYDNDLDKLNQAWWTAFWSHTFTSWDQIESPSSIGENALHGLSLDWKRFVTYQTTDFIKHEIEAIRQYSNAPITTNLMGTFPGLNYFELAKPLDVVSWDNYPMWMGDEDDHYVAAKAGMQHDLTRCLKGDRPFMLMESSPSATNWQPVAKLRRPGGHKLYSMQAIAHGSDTVQYFQYRKSRGSSEKFHGAVVDHVGHENTRVFREVAQTGKLLSSLDELVGTRVDAKVAVLYDWENRWALEAAQGFLADKHYETTVFQHYLAFYEMGVPTDVIDMSCPLDKYKIVIAPMLYLLKPGFAEKAEQFVKKGGTFVTTYITGYVDEHDLCFLNGVPGDLKNLMGIWCEEIDSLRPQDSNTMTWQGKTYTLHDHAELLHLEGAEALACYNEDFYQGMPVLTRHCVGDGRAYHIAARFGQDFLNDFCAQLCAEQQVKPVLEDLPHGMSVMSRFSETEEYIFIMNFMPYTLSVKAPGCLNLDGTPAEELQTLEARGLRILKRKK